MKKALGLLLAMLLPATALTACLFGDEISNYSDTLGVDLSKGNVIENTDTHGGFHGDGYTYVEVSFDDTDQENVCDEITASSAGWQTLPLSDDLRVAVYGGERDSSTWVPLVSSDDWEPLFPAIENGCYFFYDRSDAAENPKDDTGLLDRYSYNFTLAIYDADSGTLYYYELDT